MKLLENKTAIITGATRGIGRGIAVEFAKQGANVAFTYSSSVDAANALETELNEIGIKAKGYQSNAAEFDTAQELAKEILKEFGSIDILVNNAGITKDNLLMRISEDDFDKVIDVNLKSVFNMTKAVIRPMMKQRSGSIINMSSVVGLKGNAGQSNYAASKSGILGFSKSVALELGSRNIRSNVIAPGFIETEMTGKLDEATKIAEEKTAIAAKEMIPVLENYKSKATALPSGLLVYNIVKGEGPKPSKGTTVKLNYEGYFTDGKLFGTNIKSIDEKCGTYDVRKEQQGAYNPLPMPLNPEAQMIPGFKEGVFNMSVGDKTFLYLPSYMAYGEKGRGPIKPNTDLIFIIEMLGVAK